MQPTCFPSVLAKKQLSMRSASLVRSASDMDLQGGRMGKQG